MFQMCLVILVFAFAIPHAIMAEVQIGDDPLYCPSDAMGPVCSSDCTTLLTCVSGNLISSSKCADLSANYPYCVPNTLGCTGEPDLSYETCRPRTEPAAEFTCTSLGYFPSPYDCADYFYCATGGAVFKYSCVTNQIYDSHIGECRAVNTPETGCNTIDCALTANEYVVFPSNHAFYAFCSYADGITETIMFVCDPADTYVFNPDKRICEFKCLVEGWFEHRLNPRYFYECYYANNVLVSRIQSCPADYVFSPTESICIREVDVTSIYVNRK